MRRLLLVPIFTFLAFAAPAPAHDYCGQMRNTAFVSGETVHYKIFYTVAGMYFEAGLVNFSCTRDQYAGKPVYHMVAEGKTIPLYDNFYKVRDRYESWVDTAQLHPYKFVRNVNEDSHHQYENIAFNREANTAITDKGVYKVPECVQDVLSAIYYARNMNFEDAKPGDKIAFTMFLDDQLYPSYIRYLGRETIKTKYGRFRAIKFKPLLIEGTLFKSGEKMTVWVSDDANHIPLRVESAVVVGSVKADMMGYSNLRQPLSSRIDK